MKVFAFLLFLLSQFVAVGQSYVTKDIKSFGAKGDGKTNDQAAFEKAAAYFNQRGGNGKLVIPRGTYIIGQQDFTQGKDGKPAYFGHDVLRLVSIKNLTIEGKDGAKLKYSDSLRFGAFNPETGKVH
ncbi:MAG TPA: glycosyl hydrolase family 28-related protein, partial [Flavisolibacter sp.]|nr:glycosyl hydrolase family 28-related protein [Flavisolibacter sp.]